jgi:Raf kinase inhibitor-like YbhB/YbcL family protein
MAKLSSCRLGRLVVVGLFALAFLSCQAAEHKAVTPTPSASSAATSSQGEKTMTIVITSPAFREGSPIPKKHTGEGEDVSPPLEWTGVPEGTRQLALICDDPDAPRKEPWVHWVIYNIPADAKGLPEGVERVARPKQPAGCAQGKNSWPDGENLGYRGPMPPPGKPHRYYFKLYALDQPLDALPGLTKEGLLSKMAGHVLAEGQLMGTYQRK